VGAVTDRDCDPSPQTSSGQLDEMWRRQLVWWHTLFGALLGVSAVLMLVTRGPHLWLQLACLTGMAAAYAMWGWRGFGAMNVRAGLLYLTVAWALFLVLLFLDADGDPWILTFALFPQTWAILERRRAVPFVIVAVVAFAVVRMWQTSVTGESVAGILISSVIMLALSLVLGLFIDRIVREADSRARVIDELRQTQAQLAAAERARGVLTERERLSREIHDTLAQGFTSVVALARATESALARGDVQTASERLALIEATAAANLSEARLIVAELTPGHLQSRTLSQALQRLVDAVAAESGMTGRLHVVGDPVALAANSEVVLLRTAQEALANVRRHSGASSFTVTLTYAAEGGAVLEVSDDGAGFDPQASHRGYGLDGATARAAEVEGRFEVVSTAGEGTTVRVEVPA
jgi:signal transduction histidine kinase